MSNSLKSTTLATTFFPVQLLANYIYMHKIHRNKKSLWIDKMRYGSET